MTNPTENEIECIGCKNYYLYFSRTKMDYVITDKSSEAFHNEPWIGLRDENISNLIKLLQEHEKVLDKNKANLSAEENSISNLEEDREYDQFIAEQR